jgi:hypothetical protein
LRNWRDSTRPPGVGGRTAPAGWPR